MIMQFCIQYQTRICAQRWKNPSLNRFSLERTSVHYRSTFLLLFNKIVCISFFKNKMKALEIGRRTFIWLGVHFADEDPVSWQQKLFSVVFAIKYIVISALHVITFLKLQRINAEEFFFVLLQLVMMVHSCSAFITIYAYGSRISTVFQSLTQIYEKCKPFKL